jgi:hypothetical protein
MLSWIQVAGVRLATAEPRGGGYISAGCMAADAPSTWHGPARAHPPKSAGPCHLGWQGEIEGIDLTLTFLRQKRDQTRRLARSAPVSLGTPGVIPGSS